MGGSIMTTLHLIVARARNGVIGKDNQLPWHLPEDLKHFKRTTLGKPVIMGRKTWESLPKALPGRLNVVITRQADYVAEGATVVTSIDEALEAVKENDHAFIMGGAEIYRQTMDRVTVAHITVINADYEGDAVFEGFNENEWTLAEEDTFPATDQHPWSFSIRRYER
jgi:dihydrofolate reductase